MERRPLGEVGGPWVREVNFSGELSESQMMKGDSPSSNSGQASKNLCLSPKVRGRSSHHTS